MDTMQALAESLHPYLVRQAADKGLGFKHDSAGSPISSGFPHGPGGLLSWPGVERVFHTYVGNEGILGRIPSYPSRYMNPTYAIITGVQADSGDEQDEPCDDAPVAGLTKGCMTTQPFGRYARSTKELDVLRLGQLVDRADPMDLRLIGDPLQQVNIFSQGMANPAVPGDVLTSAISGKMWERNVAFQRKLLRQVWRGNPNNNSGGGGYKEFAGLSKLVNTGYSDAQTDTACPSVDSLLVDFNYGRLDSTGQGQNIVENLSYIMNYLEELSRDTGVNPVTWLLAMRKELFFELTKVYPCSYLTTGCQVGTPSGMQLIVDSTEQIRMRDEMRNGRFLMINGMRYEVSIDDGIPYDSNTTNSSVTSGCFSSDIYILPLSLLGGTPTLYLEYMDYQNPELVRALGLEGSMFLGRVEGAFITVPRQKNTCIQWQSTIEPRICLRTPWLACRLQNVVYCPPINARQSFTDDAYFVDGGLTSRAAPSYHNVWD